jgi:hypothetical protein
MAQNPGQQLKQNLTEDKTISNDSINLKIWLCNKTYDLTVPLNLKISSLLPLIESCSKMCVDSSNRLISHRLRTILGPLLTLEDYKIKNNDVITCAYHLGGPLLSHYAQNIGWLKSENSTETVSIADFAQEQLYGKKISREYAFRHPLTTVLNIQKCSTVEWNVKQNQDYFLDVKNLEQSVSLYRWSANGRYLNQVDNFETKKSMCNQKVTLKLVYPRHVWKAGCLYALCINTSLQNEYQDLFISYTQAIVNKKMNTLKRLVPTIFQYVNFKPCKFKDIELLNSNRQHAGNLSGYFCAYFTLAP